MVFLSRVSLGTWTTFQDRSHAQEWELKDAFVGFGFILLCFIMFVLLFDWFDLGVYLEGCLLICWGVFLLLFLFKK